MEIFIDIGIKNFCWLKYNYTDNSIKSFDIIEIKSISDITKLLDTFNNPINIELQISKNTKCKRYEYHIESYCEIKKISYNKINPKNKFKLINEICPKQYYKRKKRIIEIGNNLIAENKIKCPEIPFKKKDDIFDCILMAYTKYL